MMYDLFIGDRMFSSWSLRGWLMLESFGIAHRVHMVGLYSGTMAADLAGLAPARLVPVLRCPDGTVVAETQAIAETLAEKNPDAGHWPEGAQARATARWLCAEMAAGFHALRGACPMQMQHVHIGYTPPPEVEADLARIETLWRHARTVSGAETGPLFGRFSLADVFYTPVAVRVVGYDLPVSRQARAYCDMLVDRSEVRAWRAEAARVQYDHDPYALDLPNRPWPGTADRHEIGAVVNDP